MLQNIIHTKADAIAATAQLPGANLAQAYRAAILPRMMGLVEGRFDWNQLSFWASDCDELIVKFTAANSIYNFEAAHFDDADAETLARPKILQEMAEMVCEGLAIKGELESDDMGNFYADPGAVPLTSEDVSDWAHDDAWADRDLGAQS